MYINLVRLFIILYPIKVKEPIGPKFVCDDHAGKVYERLKVKHVAWKKCNFFNFRNLSMLSEKSAKFWVWQLREKISSWKTTFEH